MAEIVYILCAATSLLCAVLLARGYRSTRTRLLFWSSVCFAGLALNNLLLLVDVLLLPTDDISITRNLVTLGALLVLVYGLVWEAR